MANIIDRKELETAFHSENPRDVSFLIFLYLTGCRISEALGVEHKDIWIEDDYLFTRITVSKRREREFRHVLKFSMKSPFISHLISWWKIKNGKLWGMSRTTGWRIVKRWNPNYKPHDFRHTRLTNLAIKGATEMQLKQWAGWKTVAPARIYVEESPKLIESLADKVD